MSSGYYDQSGYDGEEGPLPMHGGGSRQSFRGPSSVDDSLASGWVEQLRRSKMQKVWKPVRISLSKKDLALWVQRDNNYGQTETLQRIPLSSVRRVGLVDEYMGERRFCLFVPDNLDDPQAMFRCDQPAAANKWITALQTAQERAQNPHRPPPLQIPRATATTAPPPPAAKVTPSPPPPRDLLSFHVVAPSPAAAPPQTPSPRPLGVADFDPLRNNSSSNNNNNSSNHNGRSVPAPVSAPAPSVVTTAVVGHYHHSHHHHPPTAPYSGGVPWSQQQQHHYAAQQQQQQHCQEALRQAVLQRWALKPPQMQELRTLDQLVTTVQTTFCLVAEATPYFQTWTAIPYNDLCTHHVLHAEKVDKAVRKLRAFIHPDKTAGQNVSAQGLCRVLWEILQNAPPPPVAGGAAAVQQARH